jgi:ABC-type multidrug transport system ATPase subunit
MSFANNFMIRTHDIKKVLGGRKVLDGVNFTAERKKITYLFGASGGGKSTLLKILIGAMKPDSGNVFFGDMDITGLHGDELDPFR